MDSRFRREWEGLIAGKADGDSVTHVPSEHLIAGLAAATDQDPALANAVATELLNRIRRAPYLGAALVSATLALATLLLDYLYTGTFLVLEGNGLWLIEVALVITASFSLMAYAMWRGALPRVRMALRSARP